MANIATTFRNTTTIAARKLDVPDADFDGGTNNSTCSAIGIATDNPNLEESLPEWTLLDQFGDGRTPQVSQYIGGDGTEEGSEGNGSDIAQYVIGVINPDYPNSTGTITVNGTATLTTLAAGWSLV
jgi:hypothetical protein